MFLGRSPSASVHRLTHPLRKSRDRELSGASQTRGVPWGPSADARCSARKSEGSPLTADKSVYSQFGPSRPGRTIAFDCADPHREVRSTDRRGVHAGCQGSTLSSVFSTGELLTNLVSSAGRLVPVIEDQARDCRKAPLGMISLAQLANTRAGAASGDREITRCGPQPAGRSVSEGTAMTVRGAGGFPPPPTHPLVGRSGPLTRSCGPANV